MEKQDIDNLQKTTRDYAEASWWLRNIVIGIIAIILGMVQYFKNSSIPTLMILAFLAVVYFIDKRLRRFVMQKGLGYVQQKGEIYSFKQKLSWQRILLLILTTVVCYLPLFLMDQKILADNISFLAIGILIIIIGLINRMRTTFYAGVYTIICAFIWIYPLNRVFHSHEMASWAIIYITVGFGALLSGIILFPKYKKIVREVKRTN